MIALSRDDVTDGDMAALVALIQKLPDGQLREAIAYMHDILARGNTVVVGCIEARP